MTSTAAILRDLARVRAAFQLRAIEAVITERDTRCADLLPGNAGHAGDRPASPASTAPSPKLAGATDTDLARRHGTDPDWTLREIAKAKGAAK